MLISHLFGSLDAVGTKDAVPDNKHTRIVGVTGGGAVVHAEVS